MNAKATQAPLLVALLPATVVERADVELLTERPTAAALRVLATIRDPRWQPFVAGARIDWIGMVGWARRDDGVSASVRARVKAAAALAGFAAADVDLRECAARLDEGNWLALMDGLRILREGVTR